MQYKKVFGWLALAAGMALPAAAQDGSWRDIHNDRRDLRHDYARVDRMRYDIARDRQRLNEDIRCGRGGAAAAQARDLARDQRALDSQLRDIRRDRRDLYHDYRGY
jgi:hypothetical protein